MLEQESVHVSLQAPSIPSSQHLQTTPRFANILEYPATAIESHKTINNHILYIIIYIIYITSHKNEKSNIIKKLMSQTLMRY